MGVAGCLLWITHRTAPELWLPAGWQIDIIGVDRFGAPLWSRSPTLSPRPAVTCSQLGAGRGSPRERSPSGTNLHDEYDVIEYARIRNDGGTFRAGLLAKNPDDTFVSGDGGIIAILYLDDGARVKEHARLNWDSTDRESATLPAGVGFSSTGAAATVLLDELWLTEFELSSRTSIQARPSSRWPPACPKPSPTCAHQRRRCRRRHRVGSAGDPRRCDDAAQDNRSG